MKGGMLCCAITFIQLCEKKIGAIFLFDIDCHDENTVTEMEISLLVTISLSYDISLLSSFSLYLDSKLHDTIPRSMLPAFLQLHFRDLSRIHM